MMLKDDNDDDSTSAEAESLSPSRSLTLKRCCSKAFFPSFFPRTALVLELGGGLVCI